MKNRLILAAVALLFAAACGPQSTPVPQVEATGPPQVDAALVARHAEQFDEKLGGRVAGSQEEQAAAAYISGHLQQAGYVMLLDAVPVADAVRSTNVIARAPSGEDPDVVVVVPYEATEGPPYGSALGVFLEVARAHRVVEPSHATQFVALGAEFSAAAGGNLGSRRLAQELVDDDLAPMILEIIPLTDGGPLAAGGNAAAPFGAADAGDPASAHVFEAAGFDYAYVGGDPAVVGAALLDFLAANAR